MASLSGVSVASSYTSLLKLNGNTDTLVDGASGAGIQVVDGDGTGSPLYLNTDRLGVGVAPSHELTVNNQIGIKRDGVDTFATMTFNGSGFTLDTSASSITPLTVKSGGAFLARITGDGALGIGASPSAVLHLFRNSTDTNLLIECTHSVSSASIDLRSATDRDSTVMFREGSTLKAQVLHDASADSLVLTDGANSNTVFIKSENVLIGTTNTYGRFYVQNDVVDQTGLLIKHAPASTSTASVGNISADNSNATATNGVLRVHHEDPPANVKMIQVDTTASNTVKFSVDEDGDGYFAGSLGIGMTPTEFVDIEKSDNTHRALQFTNTHNGTVASGGFKATSNAGTLYMRAISSGFSTSGRNVAGTNQILSTATNGLVVASTADIQLWTSTTKKMVIDDNSRISLSNNDGGTSNTIFGKSSSTSMSGSQQNVAFGEGTLAGTDDGIGNVALGFSCMNVGNAGNYNVGVGNQALTNVTGNNNIAIGFQSSDAVTSGSANVAIGTSSLGANTATHNNVAVGTSVLQSLEASSQNTAIGSSAMSSIGTGASGLGNCVAIGYQAFQGGVNTDTGANGTVAIGMNALTALTTGSGNTAVGYLSLQSVDDGSKCTAVGFQAGNTTEGATKSTFIGYDTEGSGANVNNETVIGSDAVGQGANSVVLGNADVTAVYMAQDSGAKVHMGDFHLQNSTSFTFNDNASHELCSFEARYTDSPTGTTGAHIAFRSSADDFTSGTETARIANIGTSGNISSNHSSSLEFHVISAHTMTKTLTVGSSDGNDRVQLHKGRLQFPDSQNADSDAHTLDDYEEGTWTPIVKDFQGTPVAFTAGSGNAGTYTKVGRMVTCNALCVTSADNSASGFVAIHGLPFAPASGNRTAVTFGNYENLAITAGHSINGNIYDTNQFIGLYVADATGGSTNMSVAEWSPDGRAYLSVTYFTD